MLKEEFVQKEEDDIKTEIGKIKAVGQLNLVSIDIYILLECASS